MSTGSDLCAGYDRMSEIWVSGGSRNQCEFRTFHYALHWHIAKEQKVDYNLIYWDSCRSSDRNIFRKFSVKKGATAVLKKEKVREESINHAYFT